MEIEEFKIVLRNEGPVCVCRKTLFDDHNWFFTSSMDAKLGDGYSIFRKAISAQLGIPATDVFLVGSAKYGFSLSPNPEKTFAMFHDESDLDLIIISDSLFSEIWSELLAAYYSGYTWISGRHSNEIFRGFAALIRNSNYQTTLLRNRAKILNGISKQVYLTTGVSRAINYRIYQTREAAIEYHASGLEKIKKELEIDS